MQPSSSYNLPVAGHRDSAVPSGHPAICEGRPFSVHNSTPSHVQVSAVHGFGVGQLARESVNTSRHCSVRRRIAEPSLASSQSPKADANHDGLRAGTIALRSATNLALGSSFASWTRFFAAICGQHTFAIDRLCCFHHCRGDELSHCQWRSIGQCKDGSADEHSGP